LGAAAAYGADPDEVTQPTPRQGRREPIPFNPFHGGA